MKSVMEKRAGAGRRDASFYHTRAVLAATAAEDDPDAGAAGQPEAWRGPLGDHPAASDTPRTDARDAAQRATALRQQPLGREELEAAQARDGASHRPDTNRERADADRVAPVPRVVHRPDVEPPRADAELRTRHARDGLLHVLDHRRRPGPPLCPRDREAVEAALDVRRAAPGHVDRPVRRDAADLVARARGHGPHGLERVDPDRPDVHGLTPVSLC